jgi:hypothetical protein
MKKNKSHSHQFIINENNLQDLDLLIKKLKSSLNLQKEFLKALGKSLSNFFEKEKVDKNIKLDDIPLLNRFLTILPDIITQLGIPFSYLFYKNLFIQKLIDLYYERGEEKIVQIFEAWTTQIYFIDCEVKNNLISIGIIKNNENKENEENKEIIKKELNQEQTLFKNIYSLLTEIDKCEDRKEYSDDNDFEKQYNNILKDLKNISFDKKNYPAQIDYYQEMAKSIKDKLNEIPEIMKNKKIKKPKINEDINTNKENEEKTNIPYINTNKENEEKKNIPYIPNKEIEEKKNIPLEKRTSFFLKEKIQEKRDQVNEFKDYQFPLTTKNYEEIRIILCSFLNADDSKGGRLYLGIDENSEVKGISLNHKNKDNLRNDLINLVYDFYPKCRVDKIYIYFIPIKESKDNKIHFVSNSYVIKIRVYPGDPEFLYSMTKLGYLSYKRVNDKCEELKPYEIYDEIIKRDGNKNKNENNIITKEKDPEPEVNQQDLENSDDEIPIFGNEEEPTKKGPGKHNKKNKIVIKISNIDTNYDINEVNKYFNDCICSIKILEGFGFLYFSNKKDAEECIAKHNGAELGTKKINLYFVNKEE